MKMKTSKGFTLTELLIVMAIIVVLAAVAIPTFTKQLETSRETADMEIIRNAYTEALSAAVQDGTDGVLDGKIGSDAADEANWGAVHYSEAEVKAAVENTAQQGEPSNAQDAVNAASYTVTLENMQNAKFKQNGTELPTSATDNVNTAGTWAYVNPKLMGYNVPAVNTTAKYLRFLFVIDSDGEVKLNPSQIGEDFDDASHLFAPFATNPNA